MSNGNGSRGNGSKPKKRKPGRPSVLTPEVVAAYLDARRRGGNDTDCAYYAGIHPDTVRRWRMRLDACDARIDPDTHTLMYADDGGDPAIPELFTLFEDIKKATAEARLLRLTQIEKAGKDGTWQAAAWWLERRYPDEYGRRERRDVSIVSNAEQTTGDVDADDDDRIIEIAAVIAEVLEGGDGGTSEGDGGGG